MSSLNPAAENGKGVPVDQPDKDEYILTAEEFKQVDIAQKKITIFLVKLIEKFSQILGKMGFDLVDFYSLFNKDGSIRPDQKFAIAAYNELFKIESETYEDLEFCAIVKTIFEAVG